MSNYGRKSQKKSDKEVKEETPQVEPKTAEANSKDKLPPRPIGGGSTGRI